MKEADEVLVVGADAKVREVGRRQVGGTVGWGAWEGLVAEEGDVMAWLWGSGAKGRRQGVDQSEVIAGIKVREAGVNGITGSAVGMKINR